jgi:hypothetical protein
MIAPKQHLLERDSLHLALDVPRRWIADDCVPNSRCTLRLSAVFHGGELWLDDRGECADLGGGLPNDSRAWRRICQTPGRYR